MEMQQPSIESQIISVLQSRPDILQPYFEEYIEDFLFAKILENTATGEYVPEEEVMRLLKE